MSILQIILLLIIGLAVILIAIIGTCWLTCEICWRWNARRLRRLSEENKQRALDLLNRQYAEAVKQQDTIIVQLERDKERYWQIIEGALNGKLDNCGVKEK